MKHPNPLPATAALPPWRGRLTRRPILLHPAMLLKTLITSAWLGLAATLPAAPAPPTPPTSGESLAWIGNGFGERMLTYPYLETELQLRFPDARLTIRNFCHPGDTATIRPHPGRKSPWAFPGAEKLRPDFRRHLGEGHFPSPDEWLAKVKADTIVAFFGYNESFEGPAGIEPFKAELEAFIRHSRSQTYNGRSAPRLILASPIAFENLSATRDLPDGTLHNANLRLYTEAMREVASKLETGFIDLFTPTLAAFEQRDDDLTLNGCHLNDAGYRLLARPLADGIYGPSPRRSRANPQAVHRAVAEKNWAWSNDYRMLNGVHSHGRRYRPFGDVNYPEEYEKLREMTRLRDGLVWQAAAGNNNPPAPDDSKTRPLTQITTNFNRPIEFLNREAALAKIEMAEGFQAEIFATESEFPNLRNPVQMSFDNKGRLWVAVLPSYPHYRAGDPKPDDKLLIYEDTNGDGRADKETVFASGLHMPIGFELAPEGVYVTQLPNLCLLVDDNNDDRADRLEVLVGGFDSHDSHHAIGAFTGDASGAVYMAEGVFLHTQLETPYGTFRGTGAGVFRFCPRSFRVDRFVQTDFANPWGLASDAWGQMYIADASPGTNWWALPISAKVPHGHNIRRVAEFAPKRSRPTAGAEFVHSRHFPDEMQGDYLVNNCIGLLGTTAWNIREDGSGFDGTVRFDLLRSTDPNFRPVDLEFAPDGSLYVVDWHNPLIGHMQHSARDPNRDNDHGRIYRITHKERPLVQPAEVAGAPIATLLENLKLPELRSRYRSHRELRGRPAAEVMPALEQWTAKLDPADPNHPHHLLQALWVAWGQNQLAARWIEPCLSSPSHPCRAAAVSVIRFELHRLPEAASWLLRAAADPHPRVRLEAAMAASWLDNPEGARIALEVLRHPLDRWMGHAIEAAMLTLRDDVETLRAAGALQLADNQGARDFLAGKMKMELPAEEVPEPPPAHLDAAHHPAFLAGREIFRRDGHCATCHGIDGKGAAEFYPPLLPNPWVEGDPDRMIKVVLKGLWGPIEVRGKTYDPKNGVPPMTPYEAILNDEEIAAVITYVRNSFGNKASPVLPADVARVREATRDKVGFYMTDELLREHPITEEETKK